VSGGSWQAVDAAVEIVRDVIKEHMRICRCTYSAQQQQPPLPQVSWQPPLPQVSWQPPLPQVSWQPPQQPPQLPLPPTTAIHMKLPVWIQNDCSSQRDLFCETCFPFDHYCSLLRVLVLEFLFYENISFLLPFLQPTLLGLNLDWYLNKTL
jgi:hypothetical protein